MPYANPADRRAFDKRRVRPKSSLVKNREKLRGRLRRAMHHFAVHPSDELEQTIADLRTEIDRTRGASGVPYKDPEDKRAYQRRRDDIQRSWITVEPESADARRLAALRALLHVAQRRYNRDPCEPFRRERDRLQNACDEIVAGPELARLRTTPHTDPLLYSHAPEVPPPPAEGDAEPIWAWLAKRYWTTERRAMYRRAMA